MGQYADPVPFMPALWQLAMDSLVLMRHNRAMKPKTRLLTFLLSVGLAANTASCEAVKMSGAEILAALNDQAITSADPAKPARQMFMASGATFYDAGGNQSQGSWKVTGDQFCTLWPPSQFWACYDVTREGKTISFISKSGTRSNFNLEK